MTDETTPAAKGSPTAEIIRALYPLAPYILVAWALGSAALDAPQAAWLPILVAGAVLIDPKPPSAAP